MINTHTTFIILAVGLSLLSLGAFTAHAQNYTAPTTAPTALPAGSTPQENFYHFIVQSPIGGTQVKIGKLGLNEEPLPQYDFRSDGLASFLSGAWASSGSFARNVCIGRSNQPSTICPQGSTPPKKLDVYGEFISQGQQANIQNNLLRHTTTLPSGNEGVQRVCSTQEGILRLCNMPPGDLSLAQICSEFPEFFGCSSGPISAPTVNPDALNTPIIPGTSIFDNMPIIDTGGDMTASPAPSTTSTDVAELVDIYCSQLQNMTDPVCAGDGQGDSAGRPIDDSGYQIQRTQDLQKSSPYFLDGALTEEGQQLNRTTVDSRSTQLTTTQEMLQSDDARELTLTSDQLSGVTQRIDYASFAESNPDYSGTFLSRTFQPQETRRRELASSLLRDSSVQLRTEQDRLKFNDLIAVSRKISNDYLRRISNPDEIGVIVSPADDFQGDESTISVDCNNGPVTCSDGYCNSIRPNHHYWGYTNAAGTVCYLNLSIPNPNDGEYIHQTYFTSSQ